MKPKTYKVKVQQDDSWLIATVTGLRAFNAAKAGVVRQGRDLDELAHMVRDAIGQITETTDFAIELLLPATLDVRRPKVAKKARRRAA